MLWVATTFVGSALLFAVQPMIARMLRPRLGGAPSVWTVSILFFQAALLAYLAVLFVAAMACPFDLVVLDAFRSGSIPVHLLTREAFPLYEERLGPDGLLARSADRLAPHGVAPVEPPDAARVWTDDRSGAWSLFRW